MLTFLRLILIELTFFKNIHCIFIKSIPTSIIYFKQKGLPPRLTFPGRSQGWQAGPDLCKIF